jgi:hypothetical protein
MKLVELAQSSGDIINGAVLKYQKTLALKKEFRM